MNKYQEAIDVLARYISDCELGIKRYCDREIDSALSKIVELEHEYEVLKEEYQADQNYIEDFDTTKDWYWKKIERLEEALDKICVFNANCNLNNWGELRKGYTTKEEWKRWVFENE